MRAGYEDSASETFVIDPGVPVYIDVISFMPEQPEEFELRIPREDYFGWEYHQPNSRHLPNRVSIDLYRLTLRAHGRNIQPVEKDFEIWVEQGISRFREVAESETTEHAAYLAQATNSLYSKFSAWVRTRIVSLKRNSFLRLLNRHSSSSK